MGPKEVSSEPYYPDEIRRAHGCSGCEQLQSQLATTNEEIEKLKKARQGGLAAANVLDDAAKRLRKITGEQNIWKSIEQLATAKAEDVKPRQEVKRATCPCGGWLEGLGCAKGAKIYECDKCGVQIVISEQPTEGGEV